MRASIPKDWSRQPGAAPEVLAQLRAAHPQLPEEHFSFLEENNGAQGWAQPSKIYVQLFSADYVLRTNEAVRPLVARAKSLIIVGGDGSRILLAYDLSQSPPDLIAVDYVEYDSADMEWRCRDLTELLTRLQTSGWFWPP